MKTQDLNRSRQAVLYFMELQVNAVIEILKNEDADHRAMIVTLQNLELTLDSATRRLGAAWFKGNRGYKISLSYKWAKDCPNEVLFDTMRHELAHIVAGREAQHGIEWQKWAIKFNAEPTTYYTECWRPQLKYDHICQKCGKDIGGSDRKWKTAKQHKGCGGRVIQVEKGKDDMKKVRPVVAEETPAGETPVVEPPAPQPMPAAAPKRKTASESSRASKAKQKAKNPELYNQIQSLASKASRLKKDPSRHGELFIIKEQLKQLRAEFAAL